MKFTFAKKLTASYLFVVAVTLLITAVLLTHRLHHTLSKQLSESLEAQANLMARMIPPDWNHPRHSHSWETEVTSWSHDTGLRVTLIALNGKVMADSDRTPEELVQMENHLTRPEVQDALRTGVGQATRMSATLQKPLFYVALRLTDHNSNVTPTGVLRVALPVEDIEKRINDLRWDLLKAGAAAMVVALIVALISVQRVNRPLQSLITTTEMIRQELYTSIPSPASRDEFGRVAESFTRMAATIEEKVRELRQERFQLNAILSALIEGVVALDAEGRILFLNPAAERLFGVHSQSVKNRPFLEGLRHSPLNDVLAQTLSRQQPLSREIILHSPSERTLSVQTLPVDYGESRSGVLAALHDITELRKLERVRQEFVANASHELKTPLTAIKGFVETLLDGAIDDPDHNRAFLSTIQEHSNRLMRLIEDLLDLSAIEAKRVNYRWEPIILKEVAERIVQGLEPMAKAKDVQIVLKLPTNLPKVRSDREKLAQILMNLLDNAIKFNKQGGQVEMSAVPDKTFLKVSIKDSGRGVAAEDLPRVFERFYRTDKSHSSEIPGTGLGLAIVKHLVEAHTGQVTVESKVGQGSTFVFTLPLA